MTGWRKLTCHTTPLVVSEEETLSEASQIEGFCDLSEEDQAMLTDWFSKLVPAEASGSEGGGHVSKKDESKKCETESEGKQVDVVEEKMEEPPALGTYLDCPFRERSAAQVLSSGPPTSCQHACATLHPRAAPPSRATLALYPREASTPPASRPYLPAI
jgi:hypothetical protein